MVGSADLRALYLPPEEAGTAWLLDPDNQTVASVLRAVEDRQPGWPCDPDAIAADLPDALVLLRERHVGFATGDRSWSRIGARLETWARVWASRLRAERPDTWGAALGLEGLRLRQILGDAHCGLRGEDRSQVATAGPRAKEAIHSEPGPAVEVQEFGDVLYIRLRRLTGSPVDVENLTEWSKQASEHFQYRRIMVDLRGNSGGDDSFTYAWTKEYLPKAIDFPNAFASWLLDGHYLTLWNQNVWYQAAYDEPLTDANELPTPRPTAELRLDRSHLTIDRGSRPWSGRMIVLVDRGAASAAESAAYWLRSGFGARLIGAPTAGLMLFGSLTPYVLPRSGLVLRLATTRCGYPDVEFTGLPVDSHLLDLHEPGQSLVSRFDQLHE